jgi:hypothetical protein
VNRLAFVVLLLSASMMPSGPARAGTAAYNFGRVLRVADASVVVPPEWDGLWATQDSVYDCTTGFKSFSSGVDTLCAGQVYTQDPGSSPVTLTCTGTADATSFHATCSGSAEVFADCQLLMEVQTDATRTGDSYRSVTTISTTYSGTGLGCDLLPATCTRVVSYGTRTGPAPVDYCLTPAKRTSWGQLKVSYR